jgi:hypothetical protein
LGCEISTLDAQEDINNKLNKIPVFMWNTERTSGNKIRESGQLKFCKTIAPPCLDAWQ